MHGAACAFCIAEDVSWQAGDITLCMCYSLGYDSTARHCRMCLHLLHELTKLTSKLQHCDVVGCKHPHLAQNWH